MNLKNIFDYRTLSVTFQDLDSFKNKLKKYGIFNKIAKYEKLRWNLELIKQFEDYLDFVELSEAKNIHWTNDIFKYYFKKWNFNKLSTNYYFCWSVNLFNQHKDKWNLESIAKLSSFPWTEPLIEENIKSIDIRTIIENTGCFLSGNFIDKHKDLIDWNGYSRKIGSSSRYFAAPI